MGREMCSGGNGSWFIPLTFVFELALEAHEHAIRVEVVVCELRYSYVFSPAALGHALHTDKLVRHGGVQGIITNVGAVVVVQ